MERERVEQRLREALGTLYIRDAFLLEQNAHEIRICHKLAEYVQRQFPAYHVDCEYNRKGDGNISKTLRSLTECQNVDSIDDERHVRPDILVHERGNNRRNLVVIEIKLDRGTGRNCDKAKLRELTGEQFEYTYTLFIELPTGEQFAEKQIIAEWYEKGEQTSGSIEISHL